MIVGLLGASLIVFGAVRLSGDPVYMVVPENAPQEIVSEYRHRLGLDRPVAVQYADFVGRLLRGDLGWSLRHNASVAALIRERLPNTARLAVISMMLALLLAIPLGVVAAARHGTGLDQVIQVLGMLGQSMPVYWTGLLLIIFVALPTGWFPTGGTGSLRHFVLPSVTLATFLMARIVRLTRSGMLECLAEDYIRTARAKGLAERAVLYRHALRNVLIPVVTVIGLQMGSLLGGAVIIETIYSLPGLGSLIVQGIYGRDFALVQSSVVILAGVFLAISLFLDVVYAWLDPRIRYS